MHVDKLKDIEVSGKTVIVRADLDVTDDYTRIETAKETLTYLLDNKAKIIIIGHKGRPDGKYVAQLSLEPLTKVISNIIGQDVKFVGDIVGNDAKNNSERLGESEIILLENLRFDKRESFDPAQDTGAEEFSRQLASLGEVYVNEAFAVSHRVHASIVGIPKLLPHAAGFRFVAELECLSRVIENPERPLVFLISGIKKDKLEMIENIKLSADKVLVAGRLPEFIGEDYHNDKVLVAQLNPDKEDVTLHSIERFEKEIEKAKTIVLAGVIGKYEDEGHRQGTRRIFQAVAKSDAYKVAGGGDTEAALTLLDLTDKFDWISVGGGAMLEYLANQSLPALEALKS
jgi:phosphoglycerate kinase